jgi:uncharacterized membrane protein
MIEFDKSIFIKRPREEVFEFVTDPKNDPEWQSAIESVERASEEPINKGSTYRYKVKFLGRNIESENEITSYEPPKQASFKSISGPIPFEGAFKFDSKDGGTHLSLNVRTEVGGFFKLAESLVGRQLNKQMESDLNSLKLLLEAN